MVDPAVAVGGVVRDGAAKAAWLANASSAKKRLRIDVSGNGRVEFKSFPTACC